MLYIDPFYEGYMYDDYYIDDYYLYPECFIDDGWYM